MTVYNQPAPAQTQKARGSHLSWLKLPEMQQYLLLLPHLGVYNFLLPHFFLFLIQSPQKTHTPFLPSPHFIVKELMGDFAHGKLSKKVAKVLFPNWFKI